MSDTDLDKAEPVKSIGSIERPVRLPSAIMCLTAAVAVLTINAVSGHIYKDKSPARVSVATISLEDIMIEGRREFISQGLSKERASLNVAYLIDYVQQEIVEIQETGRYSLIIDRDALVMGGAFDLTDQVYTDAMRAARLNMTDEGFITRKLADAGR